MKRIKVTAYINAEEMDPEFVDLDHEMGLSNEGYTRYLNALSGEMDDIEFELMDE